MPYNLKPRIMNTPTGPAHFFTCGRPGREKGRTKPVPDELVHRWVLGLRERCGPNIVIISLLGRKGGPEGKSEFWFYFFCGGSDTAAERENRPTFQEWLDAHYKDLNILVREYPTFDGNHGKFVPLETLEAVSAEIKQLISMGRTVVVVDSAGAERTGRVCTHMGAKEDSSRKA